MRRAASLLVIGLLAASTGCYHAVIDTGRPASGTVINKPWVASYIAGLVPPALMNTASQCPNGVSKVETQHSFANELVSFITFSIFTPMTVTVTCASGGTASIDAGATIQIAAAANAEQQAAAFAAAADRAARTGAPMFVKF